jgi:glycosyltransferase involved in cell wall biosynthesis
MTSTAPARIVHVTECLASGTMNFLMQATRELAEAGVRQVLVYSRRPDTPSDVRAQFDPRLELVELPPLGRAYARYFRALARELRRQLEAHAGTAVHLHSSKAGFLGRLALRGVKPAPRVFYSPHGLSFLNRRYPMLGGAFTALEWLAARAVPFTAVGCSRGEAELLGRLGPKPARVLENAVEDGFFQLRAAAPSSPPLIVTMGRICYQKAPERFAQMAIRFGVADIPSRFVWIGSGTAADEARLRAAGVQVTGWLDPAAVQQLLACATVYVQCSRWEGMPLSVLQALAAGVPCVVTNVVGNRDAVRQGITGFVSDNADAMLIGTRRLVQDEALRARFSRAARTDARERFGSGSFRSRLLGLYGLEDRRVSRVVALAEPSGRGLAKGVMATRLPHVEADKDQAPQRGNHPGLREVAVAK